MTILSIPVNTSRALIHQLPHDFAGKGVLNVLDEILQKWYVFAA